MVHQGRLHGRSRHGRALALCLLTAAILLGAAGASAAGVSRTDAVAIVTETVLQGSTDGVRLFVYPSAIEAGTTVASWKHDVFTAPASGWFLFVDRIPLANWEHPCTYIFVDAATGAVSLFDAMVPPRLQSELQEITAGRDNPLPGESEKALADFDRRLSELPHPVRQDRGRAFAFIISGGANSSNNHIRYWNDCSFIYKTLANYYEYPDENIYVCISDGLDPAVDRSDGTNSPADLDGDGDPDIMYPATTQYITQVFSELNTVLTASDQLFIFTTDHGGQESGWDCYENLWNWEELRDDQMAAFVDALPCQTVLCCFEQCFSGGMIDDLEGEGHVVATAARWDQYSYAMGNLIYDEFSYYWTAAVNWADPYGAYVDADTNGDDLVSMEEAFIYARDHDTASENPQYSSTPPELGTISNLVGNLEGVYLSVDDIVINDDNIGASHGNGNGVIEYNETIELTVALHNMGAEDGLNVTATLATGSSYVGMIAGSAQYGTIPSGGTVSNAHPFVFHVTHDVPDLQNLGFTLMMSEEPGTAALALVARAPQYFVSILNVDDELGGDGDGIPDPGEDVVLTLGIQNTGGAATPDLDVVLGTGCSFFTPDPTPHTLEALAVGGSVTEGGFGVAISASCPATYTHYLRLELSGPGPYTGMVPIVFTVGQIFADAMEAGGAAWNHYAGPGGTWTDQWHLETYRNHTVAGTTSWKCGGAGSGQYGSLLYACLETATFELPPEATLSFWNWMDAETSSAHAGYCYDGGRLEISTDGGTNWQVLTPAGGYPYRIRAGGTPGPFAAETPVWSGTHDWQEVTVDLSAYAGSVKLRWSFGSDGAVGREGWYVDDVKVSTTAPAAAGDETAAGFRPMLYAARPNPVSLAGGSAARANATIVRFALPHETRVSLAVYDASGRLVRVLAQGIYAAGENSAAWDGRDQAGQPVAAGSYFCRLSAGDAHSSQTLTVIR
jgi:hypothetical protein